MPFSRLRSMTLFHGRLANMPLQPTSGGYVAADRGGGERRSRLSGKALAGRKRPWNSLKDNQIC
jgi:hypothetical protein